VNTLSGLRKHLRDLLRLAAYLPWSLTARWKRGIIPPLHE